MEAATMVTQIFLLTACSDGSREVENAPISADESLVGSQESEPSGSDGEEVLSLGEIGTVAEIGLTDQGRDSALAKPIDAVFFGELVLVLDASAPWIRVFDRSGNHLESAIPRGEGPGETVRPFDLAADSQMVVLAHEGGIMTSGADFVFRSLSGPPTRFRGVEIACDGELITLVEGLDFPRSSAIGRLSADQSPVDTIIDFAPTRMNSRNYHPWFVTEVGDDRVIVYPEEEGRDRLLELGCDGTELRSLPLDPIGSGETVETEGDRIRVTGPGQPRPAGLGRIGDVLIWMTQSVLPAGDSVTHIAAVDPDRLTGRITVAGWYQLFDVSSDGLVLLGNSWTEFMRWDGGATWGDVPAVFLVEGARILSLLAETAATTATFPAPSSTATTISGRSP